MSRVPQEGGLGGDALADVDINTRARAPYADVYVAHISFKWGIVLPSARLALHQDHDVCAAGRHEQGLGQQPLVHIPPPDVEP